MIVSESEENLNPGRLDIQAKEEEGVDFEKITSNQIEIPKDAGFSWGKLFAYIGPAFFVSIGYLDPGNWATDIEGGSRFGYQLIWVLFMSNAMALLLQTLAARLGLVTENDLAQLCRKQYPKSICYILWGLCEIAIAATDLAEVLGTAIGLKLLFGIPLIVGVLLTAFDTLIFLVVQRYGIRKMEAIILTLLGIIVLCFAVEMVLSKPNPVLILKGFIPTLDKESLYVAIGILGATVMPHNFYLHSAMVQSRSIDRKNPQLLSQACKYNMIDCTIALNIAFFVNASILIVSAAVFNTAGISVTEIAQAHDLMEGLLDSKVAPILFGLGLVCAGQSSTLTGTLAGQIVMEGFLNMRMVPWLRRLITRLLALGPAVVVLLIMGDEGTYQLLIFSQVVLSMQLPFAVLPLMKFTSSEALMGEFKNPPWVLVCGSICAFIIIGLNMWMLGSSFVDLLHYNKDVFSYTAVITIPLAASALALMAYIIYGQEKPLPKEDKEETAVPPPGPEIYIELDSLGNKSSH